MTAILYTALAGIAAALVSLLFGHARGAKQERIRQEAEIARRDRNMATKLQVARKQHQEQIKRVVESVEKGERNQMDDKW